MTAARIQAITPIVLLDDLERGVAFFCDVLGFDVVSHSGDFAYVRLCQSAVRLIASDGPHVDMSNPPSQSGIYVDVDGLDALFDSYAANLTDIPHRAPFDQPYGQLEFHVWHENLQVIFGEAATT